MTTGLLKATVLPSPPSPIESSATEPGLSPDVPSVSFVVPTLNASRYLRACLGAIRDQDYPQDRIEIVIADGGSTDGTRTIAGEFGACVLANPLQTAEAGKAVAARHATGNLLAFVDSDNILPTADWLSQMVAPFEDARVLSSEVIFWDVNYSGLSLIDRYCALSGVNDPLCLFLGNYGRYSYLKGKWTDLRLDLVERNGYTEVHTRPGTVIPTMGANGFLIRRDVLIAAIADRDYLFDIDLMHDLVQSEPRVLARVPVSIAHFYASSLRDYAKKARRRTQDFYYHESLGDRSYPWTAFGGSAVIRFVFATAVVLPILAQAIRGFVRKPDAAWIFHPVACMVTLLTYARGYMTSKLRMRTSPFDRTSWRQ